MIAKSQLRQAAERHLSEKPTSLWARFFDIHSEEGRAEAAEWLADEVSGVLERL